MLNLFKSYEQRRAEEAAKEEAAAQAAAEERLMEMRKHTITISLKQSAKSGGSPFAVLKNRNSVRTVGVIKHFDGITDMDGFSIQFTDAFRGVFAGLFGSEQFFQQAARMAKAAKVPSGYELDLVVAVDPILLTQLVASAQYGYEGNMDGEDMRFAFSGLQVLSVSKGVIMSSTNQTDAEYQNLSAEQRQAALEAMARKNKDIATARNRKTLAEYRAQTLGSAEAGTNTNVVIDV